MPGDLDRVGATCSPSYRTALKAPRMAEPRVSVVVQSVRSSAWLVAATCSAASIVLAASSASTFTRACSTLWRAVIQAVNATATKRHTFKNTSMTASMPLPSPSTLTNSPRKLLRNMITQPWRNGTYGSCRGEESMTTACLRRSSQNPHEKTMLSVDLKPHPKQQKTIRAWSRGCARLGLDAIAYGTHGSARDFSDCHRFV